MSFSKNGTVNVGNSIKRLQRLPKDNQPSAESRTVSASASAVLQIAVVRGRLQEQTQELDVVCPIEGIEDVEFGDVFVEPLLSDKSAYDRDTEARKTLCLDDLLRSKSNLLLAGRPEFGKTTILRYARDFILRHDKHFDTQIPVSLKFSDLPKNNPKSTIRCIAKVLGLPDGEIDPSRSVDNWPC